MTDQDRSASRNPYYVAQRMIILGKTEVLLSQFADRIDGLEESVSPQYVSILVASVQVASLKPLSD
jgi:nuclear pore complex protein Nup107